MYVLNLLILPKRPPVLILLAAKNLTMTPEDILSTISTAKMTFVPISGKPTYNELIRLS